MVFASAGRDLRFYTQSCVWPKEHPMWLSFKAGVDLMSVLIPIAPPQSARLANAATDRLSPYQSATVELPGGTWRFPLASNGEGIRARVERDRAHTEFDLDCNGELGQVVGPVAVGRDSMTGLGAAELSEPGNAIEHRKTFIRLGSELTVNRDEISWSGSSFPRLLEEPFNMMAIVLSQGDSVVCTLDSMTRADDTTIETHRFVNHCPPPPQNTFDRFTYHRQTTFKGVSVGETIIEQR